MDKGVVEINLEGTELRAAMNRGDFVGKATLCAQYLASAVAEYAAASDEDKKVTLTNASKLFGALVRRLGLEPGRRQR